MTVVAGLVVLFALGFGFGWVARGDVLHRRYNRAAQCVCGRPPHENGLYLDCLRYRPFGGRP